MDYRYIGKSILEMPMQLLIDAVAYVARHESPMLRADLVKAVVTIFGTKAGSRIRARLDEAIVEAIRQGRLVEERGFCREASVVCELRSRTGTGSPAESIAPEEYRLAVVSILEQGQPFTREALVAEVRGVFGYGAASAALRENVLGTVEELIALGRIGEGATGLAWRER